MTTSNAELDRAGGGAGHLEAPARIPLSGWRELAIRVKNQFSEDHVTLTSAGVAFFGFAALVPFLAAAISVYGLVADPEDVGALVARLGSAVPSEVSSLIEQQLDSVTRASPGALGLATLTAVALAIWSASSGMSHLIEAVNIAYGEDDDDRPIWIRRGLALAMTLGLLAMLTVAVAVISLGTRLGSGPTALAIEVVSWVVVAALAIVGLAVLYRYGPDRDEPRWRWVSPGAVIAVVAWIGASLAFRFYVARFGSYNETYGSLGAIVIVLTWLYLSAVAILVGAEINSEIENQASVADPTANEREPR